MIHSLVSHSEKKLRHRNEAANVMGRTCDEAMIILLKKRSVHPLAEKHIPELRNELSLILAKYNSIELFISSLLTGG